MKKQVAVALSTVVLSIAGVSPALAGDDNPVVKAFMLPVKVVAFGASAVIGTPVAILRTTAKNTCSSSKSMSGDSSNPVVKGLAGLAALPLGVFTGTLEGSYYGLKNAAMNTEKPFCKEAFSLGELGDDK